MISAKIVKEQVDKAMVDFAEKCKDEVLATIQLMLSQENNIEERIYLGEQFRLEGLAEKKERIIQENFNNTGFIMPGMFKRFKDKVDELVKTDLAELYWELLSIPEGTEKKVVLYLGEKLAR